jgi:ATP-dependent helicase YprA (DUF1998 family)
VTAPHSSSLVERFETDVFGPYIDLLRSDYRFHDRFALAQRAWEEQLTFDALVRGPYVEGAYLYASGRPLGELALAPQTLRSVTAKMGSRVPYQHQSQAIEMLLGGHNALVTTGTSSGKTLCYQIPILDDLIRNPGPGVRAIIIYPLNALANDQIADWNDLLGGLDVTFARFTGQTPNDQKDYEALVYEEIASAEDDVGLSANERSRRIQARVRKRLEEDRGPHRNRLNHREAIRADPPNILITNFSMLEYLLERPIDASVFEGSRLHFVVLDEVHSYRGIQSTEIAFLIRRLKTRLGIDDLRCIATSATLGKSDAAARIEARRFASDLFGEPFEEPNPLRGAARQVILDQPAILPGPSDYIAAFDAASSVLGSEDREQAEVAADRAAALCLIPDADGLAEVLARDANVYDLRQRYLSGPRLLADAAADLWPDRADGPAGLTALLGLVAWEGRGRDLPLLPARQHYFLRSMEGLFVCLRLDCPARSGEAPAWFVVRSHGGVADGECPACSITGHQSQLVETVGCRTCGYLFGALQDRGPKEQALGEAGEPNTPFDTFSTDLGEDNEAFRSYFTIESEMPWPGGVSGDDQEDDQDEGLLPTVVMTLPWCAACGLRIAHGEGGACKCSPTKQHARAIRIVHRQCEVDPEDRRKTDANLRRRRLMRECPNCHYKRVSVEPVQRYREWRDEMGAAMAIPLSYFQMRPTAVRKTSKLLCFTDNRQRAAAFPTLLEERAFPNDFGRALLSILRDRGPIAIADLGGELEVIAADERNRLFLPSARLPDGVADQRTVRNAWNAEVMAHFATLDAAGRTPEDLGLLAVRYHLDTDWSNGPRRRLAAFGLDAQEADAVVQVLLGFLRRDKAVTMPTGVDPDAPAFGSIPWKFVYALTTGEKREGLTVRGWMRATERLKRFGPTRVGDYLSRLLGAPPGDLYNVAGGIWDDLCEEHVLVRLNVGDFYQVDHEGLVASLVEPDGRFVCDRCHAVTSLAPGATCPRLGCRGTLVARPWVASEQSLVGRWVSGDDQRFAAVRVAEHTAQIAKSNAEQIERAFRSEDAAGRAGVDVLSSTTTFEMGINIGDLQTVLLRNAPRSSANYVQRVGRAGRGRDKNAICVTLCDRTPYAIDVWQTPELIMGGEVRAPTVFLANALIAQRHFNAYLFADFLRQRILVERAIAKPKQSLEIANFLRKNGLSFAFPDWLPEQKSSVLLDFAACLDATPRVRLDGPMRAIVDAIGGEDSAYQASRDGYETTTAAIDAEIDVFMAKRLENVAAGKSTAGLERTVKNILRESAIDLMARAGFLPRYAFPLDVVALQTEDSEWTRSDVVLQRDQSVAIVEYAPGSTVVANKKSFKSEGLYIATARDQPKLMYFARCPDCTRVVIYLVKPEFEDGPPDCPCGRVGVKPRPFIEPRAFSIGPDSRKEGRFTRYRRGMSDRQVQSAVSFIDAIPDGEYERAGSFDLGFKADGHLFRSNAGPGGKGFAFCRLCGWGLPETEVPKAVRQQHPSLRAWGAKERTCDGGLGIRYTLLGHRFSSLCLSLRPFRAFDEGLAVSMAAALQRGICEVLGIDMNDIGVVLQFFPDRIVFYDNTAGGAGFVLEAKDRWLEVESRALRVARDCACQGACHRCLKHFGNQSAYSKLDRLRVASFLDLTWRAEAQPAS